MFVIRSGLHATYSANSYAHGSLLPVESKARSESGTACTCIVAILQKFRIDNYFRGRLREDSRKVIVYGGCWSGNKRLAHPAAAAKPHMVRDDLWRVRQIFGGRACKLDKLGSTLAAPQKAPETWVPDCPVGIKLHGADANSHQRQEEKTQQIKPHF